MKIAYVTAGAGGMYCGSCMRDNTLARALIDLGHPTVLVPTYTPLRTDEESVSGERVFYGGIEVFLAQKFPFLRRPIPGLDRALAAPWLLKAVSKLSVTTDPAVLGDLAISVLQGEGGHQRKALEELVGFLEWEVRPEVVHLTNSLFAGLAPALKRRLRVPVVCSLQGEDLFLEGIPAPQRRRCIELIRAASADIAAFVAVSRFAADFMAGYLEVPREKIRVISPGLRLDGWPAIGAPRPAGGPFTVGYLARIAPEKGLAVLVEAFRTLRQDLSAGAAVPPRLRAAGYLGRADRPYLESIRRRIEEWGLAGGFEYLGEVDRAAKIEFLRSIDVLCVPSTYPEALGLFVYEALAAGTPVVLPRSGAFPEIVEATGGGLLVDAGDPGALAEGLRRLMEDPALRAELGRRGAEAVRARFDDRAMALATLEVYRSILPGGLPGGT